MYDKLAAERPTVAVHMRSAKTFTPEAGTLLASILDENAAQAARRVRPVATMRRGFKAEAERLAQSTRASMRLKPTQALDAVDLAKAPWSSVRSADELTAMANLEALEHLQPGAFSACTFDLGERTVIVFNPLSSPGRRQSDISHEAAHLLLHHGVKEVESFGGLSFFTCDPDEEQEANWLAGCLLLPRELLRRAVYAGSMWTASWKSTV
jgi:hypothetical protein